MKSVVAANSHIGRSSTFSFFKPQYRRSLAVVGTSGLLFGVGFADTSPALSNGVIDCTNRTVTAADKDATAQVDAIEEMAFAESERDGEDIVCLNGSFVINDEIFLIDSTENVTFYGVGASSSIEHAGGTVVRAAWPESLLTINNLTISGSENAIFGYNVSIINSTFSGNTSTNPGAAILATETVTISNSSFSNNIADNYGGAILAAGNATVVNSSFSLNSSSMDGGAIATEGTITVSNSTFFSNSSEGNGGAIIATEVEVSNSTFASNTALNGGAIYSLPLADFPPSGSIDARNSTFLGNQADEEGGAIFAEEGVTYFSTFVNNLAATPDEDPLVDTPGNAIYKSGTETFNLAGNIFAGNSPYPQLGIGAPVTATTFTDQGGNIFSTPAEPDISGTYSPVFGASLTSLFGTNSPALATYAPNTNGTQTIALGPGSPALNAVPDLAPYNLITLDQRGQTRSFPADAGAFQGFVIPTSTPNSTTPAVLAKTGNENLFWSSLASGSLIVFGTLVAMVTSRLRRRTTNH